MGSFFWVWFQQNPFLSHIFSSFFSVGGLALTFRIWTLLEIIPRRKRSTMRKYKYINLFLRVYSINSTFHDTAMCVGQLWEKMVQVADWLTHYLTQFNGERPDMVSMFWDVRITVFCLLYIWKKHYFSRANFFDGSHAPVCRTLWKTSEPKFKDSVKWTISSGRLGQLFR